jgi:thermitase
MRHEATRLGRCLPAGAALILLCLVLSGAGVAEARVAGGEASAFSGEFVAGEIIVKIAAGATDADLERLNKRNDAETEEELPEGDLAVVDLPGDLTVREAIEVYEDSPDIEYAEPDYILRPLATPNDTDFSALYGLHNTGQTGGTPDADIDAPEAWDATTGNQETMVAVIDEGVDINHPDLRDNIWTNPDEIPDNNIDDDGNGYEDDVHGWDFHNNDASVYDPDPVTGKGDEHGTHVAGTIAARGNNEIGVVGVNWQARIMPLKFLGANGGSTSNAIKAIDYAIAEGVRISNNSWGGGGSRTLRESIERAEAAGHLFVAAAGNKGTNNDTTPSYPASYDLPNIISVAATNHNDALASFSNFGVSSVDLASPGANIRSTLPNGKYGSMSGTSMATPHVSGVAALLEGREPGMGYAAIKARILGSVDQKSGLSKKVASGGRLNAAAAISQESTQVPDAAPTITPVNPKPGSRIRKTSVRIVATVRDDRANLASGDIRVYMDGRTRDFTYEPDGGRLVAESGRLARGTHVIKIEATDAAGNTNSRTWNFKITR